MREPNQTKGAEFDRFSDSYGKILDENVRITGDTSEYFAAYKAKYVASRVVQKPQCKILDYGCGIGSLAGFLKSYLPAARLDGYDLSARSLRQIDKALVGQGCFTSKLDELATDYDVVVVANVLHHIAPELRQAAVAEITTRIAPSGQAVIFEHNPLNPITRWAVARCPFDENAALLSPRETSGYLRQIGMQIMRRDYIVFFPRSLRWFRPLEPFLSSCGLGAQYAVVARKFPIVTAGIPATNCTLANG